MKTNNKGEWSEFYAFLKILEDRKLPAADKELNSIADKFFLFQKVIREEIGNSVRIYDISSDPTNVLITDENGKILKQYDANCLKGKTLKIFERIKSETSATFCIPEAQILMDELLCTKVKAENARKADIVAVIYDRISNTLPMLGFSVKSMIGGASTLLNPGNTTNFIYEVCGYDGSIEEVNSMVGKSQIRDRVRAIMERGGQLKYSGIPNKQFEKNLKIIDTAMPEFVAQILLDFFSNQRRTVAALTEELSKNPKLKKYNMLMSDYEYKIKNLLDAIALGMVPSKQWDGYSKAHGGYIVVKNNGDVVCYHLYNRDEFRSYLFENTRLDAPSTSRYGYGVLYEENDKKYFKLNLQIRFLH